MNDLISRAEAIEAMLTWDKFGCDGLSQLVPWREGLVPYVHLEDMLTAISNLPSAEHQRKRGKWVYEGARGRFPVCRCSVCGNRENADWAVLGNNVNYCPNCGAEMKGEGDDRSDM